MNFYEFIQFEGTNMKRGVGEHIFRQGDLNRSLYFVESGLLKAYYTSDNGKESIKSFLIPNDIIGSLTSAHSQMDCSFSLLCLEKSVLREISFDAIRKYCRRDIEFANSMIDILLQFAMKKERREYEFLCLSAEARFRLLESDYSGHLEKVTQNDLARYLGITPVGLSRIKKRVYREGGSI